MDLDALQSRSTSSVNHAFSRGKADGSGFSGIMQLVAHRLTSEERVSENARDHNTKANDAVAARYDEDARYAHRDELERDDASIDTARTSSERAPLPTTPAADDTPPFDGGAQFAPDPSLGETPSASETGAIDPADRNIASTGGTPAEAATAPAVPATAAASTPVDKPATTPTAAPTTDAPVAGTPVASAPVTGTSVAGTPATEPVTERPATAAEPTAQHATPRPQNGPVEATPTVAASPPQPTTPTTVATPSAGASPSVSNQPGLVSTATPTPIQPTPVASRGTGNTATRPSEPVLAPVEKPSLAMSATPPAAESSLGTGARTQPLNGNASSAAPLPSPPKVAGETPALVTQSLKPSPPSANETGTPPAAVKVTVEQPIIVARSQGGSSAALVQAQLVAAGSNDTARAPIHVGSGQPLHVGAEPTSAGGQATQGQAGGQSNTQSGGGNQGNPSNGGQMNQAAGFGLTIGQRGFGGDAARAQFQDILATRTARPAPSSTLPTQAATTSGSLGSSSFLTAGPGGLQSTHTANSVFRADSTAPGRPGAMAGTAVDQVAVKLANTAKDGGGRISIQLNPEELGKVDVKMEIGRDGLVKATVLADKAETLDLLQRDAKALEKALQDAGLKTDRDSLDFDLRGRDGGDGRNNGRDVANDDGGRGQVGDSDDTTSDTAEADSAETGGAMADGSLNLVA